VLKLLHTADLHLGLESAQFEPDAADGWRVPA
jgi:DNA repair exonuclease SbcCD nuclease subunit